MRRKLLILLAVVAVMAWGSVASADLYTLLAGNTALAGFPTPFGTVTTSVLAGNLVVDFEATQNIGGFDYKFGHNGALDINIPLANLAGLTAAMITGLPAGFGPATIGDPGANVDGFGNFNISIDGPGASGTQASVIFTVDSPTDFASAALVPNSDGNPVAAGIFVFEHGTSNVVTTGFASVPLPGALVLLGGGLVRLVAYSRKRKALAA